MKNSSKKVEESTKAAIAPMQCYMLPNNFPIEEFFNLFKLVYNQIINNGLS